MASLLRRVDQGPLSIQADCLLDETAIPRGLQCARQQAMTFGALLVPMPEFGNHRKVAPALGDDPLDRHVEVPHHAELAVQPFQFGPDIRPQGVVDHRRKEADGGPQMRQCDSDLMQRIGIAAAGAVVLGDNGIEVPASDDPECRIAGQAGAEAAGRALRFAASVARAAVAVVVGRAILARANQVALLPAVIASRLFWSVCSCGPDASMVAQPTWPIL